MNWRLVSGDVDGNLLAGHVYDVKVNRETNNPRIVRVLREVID
jgi:hypothetical protein